jgi:hypothetical protein
MRFVTNGKRIEPTVASVSSSGVAVNDQRTDTVPTLQGFVSARLADLTNVGGFTDRARDVCRTVVSVRAARPPQPAVRPRPRYIVIGHDLPRISPGVERC